MKSAALLLAACVALFPLAQANAEEPPDSVRLFRFAGNDNLAAFVDFPSLKSDGSTRTGWTYLVLAEPKHNDAFANPIGSYWEAFAGECDSHVVNSRGLKILDTFSQEMVNTVGNDSAKIARQASEGTFDAYLLAMVCGGNGEPTDQKPFVAASDAYFKAFK
jgi:hypothetical protein